MKNLISMTDFVLEQTKAYVNDKEIKANIGLHDYLKRTSSYANFLKQPLELWMFVPCDEKGNVLERPECSLGKECYSPPCVKYQQAKERCLFEGFEYVNEDFIHNTIHYFIKKEDSKIMWNFNNEWRFYPEFKTIEDLVKYNSKLTPTAIKQLGL